MKITPEIEAVARAIARSDDADPDYCIEHNGKLVPFWTLRIENAIAAIRALRKLSFEASLAGGLVIADRLANDKAPSAVEVHAAMIDAALGENK